MTNPHPDAFQDEGIRLKVSPWFSLARSEPAQGSFVFSYRVRLENAGAEPAQLLYRFWRIHDSIGEDTEVDGEGVVGRQPLLLPGDSHVYTSHCVLKSTRGFMEGHFTFTRPDGRRFRVPIPRFILQAPILPPPDGGESVVMH